jgi:hypothetical protein
MTWRELRDKDGKLPGLPPSCGLEFAPRAGWAVTSEHDGGRLVGVHLNLAVTKGFEAFLDVAHPRRGAASWAAPLAGVAGLLDLVEAYWNDCV